MVKGRVGLLACQYVFCLLDEFGMMCSAGWVQTDMGGEKAPTTVEESVSGMLDVLRKHEADLQGAWHDFNGKVIPW
jgi:hypothetical protein